MKLFITSLLLLHCYFLTAQTKTVVLDVELTNALGDFHKSIKVYLKDQATGKTQMSITSKSGIARFIVQKGRVYEIKPENYYKAFVKQIADDRAASVSVYYTYQSSAQNPEEKYKLSAPQVALINDYTIKLKDSSIQSVPLKADEWMFAKVRIFVQYRGKPIPNEKVYLRIGRSAKTILAQTNEKGRLTVYLPKGDTVWLNFKYDPNFSTLYYYPSQFEQITDLEIDYIGSVALERIENERAERIRIENERLAKERKEFEERLKSTKASAKDEFKKEFSSSVSTRNEILEIFNRNKQWKRKLVVCDITGSMSPYIAELMVWLKLNFEKEKGIQFVFFNDGDNKPDHLKVAGKTGGIYYTQPKSYDELLNFASTVAAKGSGGDAPENNIEALIKAIQSAQDYDEIIMIADSYAPISDIKLCKHIQKPIHTILCGYQSGNIVEPDYISLSWSSRGSIHTIEQDIETIAKTMDGQIITLYGRKYKLLNGRFIPLNEI